MKAALEIFRKTLECQNLVSIYFLVDFCLETLSKLVPKKFSDILGTAISESTSELFLIIQRELTS